MDSALTQGAPAPGASPSRLVGRPSSSGPRGGSRWPVSKEKSQNFYYLHVWAKVQSIIQAPGPGAAGEGRRNVRRFLCQARAWGGTGRGAGARIVQPRGTRAQPPSAASEDAAVPGGLHELGGPFPSRPQFPPQPGWGPGAPRWIGASILGDCVLVAHTRDVTAGTLELSSSQGCRFCKAKSDELCRQSGSGWIESLRLFWKASCCSCSMSRLACCRSASRSSAVCRLHRGRERDSTVRRPAPRGRQRDPNPPGSRAQPGASRRRVRLPPARIVCRAPAGPGSGLGSFFVVVVRQEIARRGLHPPPTCTPGYCGFANNKDCLRVIQGRAMCN